MKNADKSPHWTGDFSSIIVDEDPAVGRSLSAVSGGPPPHTDRAFHVIAPIPPVRAVAP